jgi:hypothetical protein
MERLDRLGAVMVVLAPRGETIIVAEGVWSLRVL